MQEKNLWIFMIPLDIYGLFVRNVRSNNWKWWKTYVV